MLPKIALLRALRMLDSLSIAEPGQWVRVSPMEPGYDCAPYIKQRICFCPLLELADRHGLLPVRRETAAREMDVPMFVNCVRMLFTKYGIDPRIGERMISAYDHESNTLDGLRSMIDVFDSAR